jgi:hypothetical protein
MGEEEKCIDGKPEAKCPLRNPWRRWKENIKIYLLKSRICSVNCIYLAQHMGQGAMSCEYNHEPSSS